MVHGQLILNRNVFSGEMLDNYKPVYCHCGKPLFVILCIQICVYHHFFKFHIVHVVCVCSFARTSEATLSIWRRLVETVACVSGSSMPRPMFSSQLNKLTHCSVKFKCTHVMYFVPAIQLCCFDTISWESLIAVKYHYNYLLRFPGRTLVSCCLAQMNLDNGYQNGCVCYA